MTDKQLYPNPFYSWRGWDLIKWLFAAALILTIIYGISKLNKKQDPCKEIHKDLRKIILKRDGLV